MTQSIDERLTKLEAQVARLEETVKEVRKLLVLSIEANFKMFELHKRLKRSIEEGNK